MPLPQKTARPWAAAATRSTQGPQARRAAGLMQADMAAKLRRPQSFVSTCESGERRMNVVELIEVNRLYGKELTFFVR